MEQTTKGLYEIFIKQISVQFTINSNGLKGLMVH